MKEPNVKKKKTKYVSGDNDTDVVQVKQLLERRFYRGKVKFKGNLPMKCFSCNEVGQIVTRFLEKKNTEVVTKYKSRRDEDNKDYKDIGKKSCYITKEETHDGSNNHDNEVVYVAMKDESQKDKATVLMSCVNKNDRWIIDSGCSHYMTGDKSKFVILKYYDRNSVRFGNDTPCMIKGKGSIKLTENILFNNAYYVEGLNHNLLSVSQQNNSGCKVEFGNKIAKIYDIDEKIIEKGDKTRGNLFYFDIEDATCLVVEFDDVLLWQMRLYHVNFDTLVSISNLRRVRGFPKLKKPDKIICKQY